MRDKIVDLIFAYCIVSVVLILYVATTEPVKTDSHAASVTRIAKIVERPERGPIAPKTKENVEVITLGYIGKKYEPAEFTHWKHQDEYWFGNLPITCVACHHESKKSDGSDAQGCTKCHLPEESVKDDKKVPKIEDAFHDQCKACHKKARKQDGNKLALTTCKGCHAKKK